MATGPAGGSNAAETDSGRWPRPLLIGDGWHSDRPGGLNRYLADLVAALNRAGVVARGALLGPAVGAPVGIIAGGREQQPLPGRLWCLWRASTHGVADVNLVDAHFALNALVPTTLGALRRLPLVVHFQGPWAAESLVAGLGQPWKIELKRLAESVVYHRARRIVVLSTAFKRLIIERYGVAPWIVHVVPPGVDLVRFRPGPRSEARQRIGVDQDAYVVVAVRRLVPRMGLDVLLEAWPAVRAAHPQALLLIVGEGTELAALKALAGRLGVGSSVRFTGRVNDDDLLGCYQAADVSVVPTTALEGFGLIVTEALACGTPVIASNVGSLPEVLTPLDPSLIVAGGDSGALADRIDAALADPGSLPSAERCRAYAETFTWEAAARRHVEIYSAALNPVEAPLRVVFVDHCAKLSGGELALLRLLPAFTGVDHHVVLGEEGPLVGRLLTAGVSMEVLPMAAEARHLSKDRVKPGGIPGRSAVASAVYVARLARRLRRLRPDVVHTNSLKAALYGGVAARIAGVPVVWHVRDHISPEYLPGAAVRLVRVLARRLPAAVIANSQSTLDSLGPLRCPSTVVPSPVDPRLLESSSDPASSRRDCVDEMRIGIVGRLAPWKGQHVFLKAFSEAFPEGSQQAAVVGSAIFGETDYEQELLALSARLGLDGRVDFRGFRDDVGGELGRLDVFVHASVTPEPFGLVVVEAMAMRLPVVAADAGGPAEVIENGVTGLLYQPGNVAELATHLRALAADPELRRRLGDAGRRRAEDFHPEPLARRVAEFYTEALGLAGRGSGRRSPSGEPR